MPHFTCPQSSYEEGEHFHIYVSISFSQVVIMLIQEAQTHFAKAILRSQKIKGYSGCCSKLAVCQLENSSPIPSHT